MATLIKNILVAGLVTVSGFAGSAEATPRFPGQSVVQSRCEIRAGRRVALATVLASRLKGLQEKLNITAEQRTQIRSVLAQFAPELKQELLTIGKARAAMGKAMRQTTLSQSEIETSATALGDAIKSLAVTRGTLYAELAKILSPEQLSLITSEIDSIQSSVEQALSGVFLKMAV